MLAVGLQRHISTHGNIWRSVLEIDMSNLMRDLYYWVNYVTSL